MNTILGLVNPETGKEFKKLWEVSNHTKLVLHYLKQKN